MKFSLKKIIKKLLIKEEAKIEYLWNKKTIQENQDENELEIIIGKKKNSNKKLKGIKEEEKACKKRN